MLRKTCIYLQPAVCGNGNFYDSASVCAGLWSNMIRPSKPSCLLLCGLLCAAVLLKGTSAQSLSPVGGSGAGDAWINLYGYTPAAFSIWLASDYQSVSMCQTSGYNQQRCPPNGKTASCTCYKCVRVVYRGFSSAVWFVLSCQV